MLFRKEPKPAAPPAPTVHAEIANGEPDMRGLGRALWRRKVMISGLTLLSAGAAFLTVNTITPRYQSEARLLLEARENVFLRAEADKTGERTTIDPEAVTSQIQLVLSRDLAREVIEKEKLAGKPEFDPAAGLSRLRLILGALGFVRDLSAMSREERALEAYYDRLNVYAVEKSRVIAIDFSSENSELAAKIANTIAETYLNRQQAAKQEQTRAASLWLAGEIDKMRTRVAEAEAKVEDYRSRAKLYAGSNNTSLPSQQLTEINSQIAAARGQKADLEARASQLRDQMRSGKPIDSADIAGSDTMRRLIEQRIAVRAQLAEQSTTLLDQHPRIKELKAQIGEIDRQIQTEGERLLRQLDNDAKVAGDRLAALTANLDQAKKIASETSEQDVQLRALEREAKTQRDLLESYLVKYREAAARDSISAAPPEARIISRATPAIKPNYPKKLAIVLIAAFAVFTLSAGFVVTNALLAAPVPSYGFADGPAPDAPRVTPAREVVSPPLAPAAPLQETVSGYAVRTIDRVARDMHSAGDSGRVAVIGIARNVGTTYAAITLARALAQDASVVLVDLAFGAPNLSVVSTDPGAPGIAELTRGKASFGDIITRDQYSRVHLVAAGEVGNDVVALSSSPMPAMVIEALGRSYEYVVIDAGSAGDVSPDRLAPLAARAMLVAADPSSSATKAVRERLLSAGFREVAVIAGSAEAVAA
ncbi:MAG TPA: exopolysaccharide transport family protein [Pseudolabrys sp.]|nr:exopolysaccharide transport family protein [Pseudolabrys sp.]